MIDWLEEFYGSDDLRATLLTALGPLFTRYASDVWQAEGEKGEAPAVFVEGLVTAYVAHHLDSSRIQLQEVVAAAGDEGPLDAIRARLTEWAERRPDKVAANETIRTANAVALEQMRSSGVTRKVWASSGGACPFCASLDGVTVEVDRDFFTPDDTYQPEGAETPMTFTSSIGHPPIHQGCDCSVVPG